MVALGLIGFIFPFLPGWPPFLFGVILISPHHGHKLLNYIKAQIDKIKAKFKR